MTIPAGARLGAYEVVAALVPRRALAGEASSASAARVSASPRPLRTGEGSGATPAIYLRSTDGAPAVRLGEGVGGALSPDGKSVLGLSEAREGKPAHLMLLPTGPGQAKALADAGLNEFGGVAFLPDGKRVVFSAEGPGRPSRLYVQEIPDGSARPISPEGVRLPPFSNPVSPDGRLVVGRSKRRYFLYSVDGKDAIPVPGVSDGDLLCRWTADGRSLYFYQRGTSPMPVFLVDVQTGARKLFREIPHEGGASRLRITPDGQSYVYRGNHVLSELYVVEGLR